MSEVIVNLSTIKEKFTSELATGKKVAASIGSDVDEVLDKLIKKHGEAFEPECTNDTDI